MQQALFAAKAAAAIMGMNNIFYRFRHLSGNEKYATMPARLRMQVDPPRTAAIPWTFELWCLAVSAINGCGVCVDAHEKVLHEKGCRRRNRPRRGANRVHRSRAGRRL